MPEHDRKGAGALDTTCRTVQLLHIGSRKGAEVPRTGRAHCSSMDGCVAHSGVVQRGIGLWPMVRQLVSDPVRANLLLSSALGIVFEGHRTVGAVRSDTTCRLLDLGSSVQRR
jgi:hypothetical protein